MKKLDVKYGQIRNAILLLSSISTVFLLFHTCARFEPLSKLIVHTDDITIISHNEFLAEGMISYMGEGDIVQHGFCWSESKVPTVDLGSKVQLGARDTAGRFTHIVTGLTANTTYFVRAYATNQDTTKYGEEKYLTTALPPAAPAVSTAAVSEITSSSAQSGGTIISDRGDSIIAKGVCWSTSTNPTISDQHTEDGTGTGSYTSSITGLDCGTTYYVRAYATNAVGTGYGDTISFTTDDCLGDKPTVITTAISIVTETTAEGGGEITDDGGSEITARGVCWSTSQNPTIADSYTEDGAGSGIFSSSLKGLNCETTYFVRAYASNAAGTGYGETISFTTKECSGDKPTVTTTPITNVAETSAEGGGEITDDGGLEITARGVCWSTSQNPTIQNDLTNDGSGSGVFSSSITGLNCGTTYYVRAYASNAAGTSYGPEITFKTSDCTAELPTVSTASISSITHNSAQGGGEVIEDGGSELTARGVCWSTTQNPTVSDNKTEDGTGTGSFTSNLTGLECETKYYVRAYATNAAGIAYGDQLSFTTDDCPADLATVSTLPASSIGESSAQSGGEITDDGGATVTARGVCWSTSQNPTIADSKTTDGGGTGTFTSSLTDLSCETTYYLRAYATNSAGTAYGSQEEFTTTSCTPTRPTVTTAVIDIGSITETSADGGGNVTDEGSAPVTSKGVCWSTSENPTVFDDLTEDGSGPGAYTSSITGLLCNTPYYVRAYAINDAGIAYGEQVIFTTNACSVLNKPTVTTGSINNVTDNSAKVDGDVTDNGGAAVTERGVCWSTSENPEITDDTTVNGSGTGSFTGSITGLSENTTYYVRAYATNSEGTGYGSEESFTTESFSGTLTDIDGNEYQTVEIGDQIWMKENLKVTRYADETEIDRKQPWFWDDLDNSQKAYGYYRNQSINFDTYGALYTWAAATDGMSSSTNPSGVQGVCPDGWHLPSDEEWKQLEMSQGMSQSEADDTNWRGTDEGGKLKESDYEHWSVPNTGATNSSGFTALPGGMNNGNSGGSQELHSFAYFWTSTESSTDNAWFRGLFNNLGTINRNSSIAKNYGFSVRCVKD